MEGLATGRAADKVVAVYFFIADGTVEVQMVAFNGLNESGVALHFYGSLRLRFASLTVCFAYCLYHSL
jgi:EamA domain-containing membrane protein RarD